MEVKPLYDRGELLREIEANEEAERAFPWEQANNQVSYLWESLDALALLRDDLLEDAFGQRDKPLSNYDMYVALDENVEEMREVLTILSDRIKRHTPQPIMAEKTEEA